MYIQGLIIQCCISETIIYEIVPQTIRSNWRCLIDTYKDTTLIINTFNGKRIVLQRLNYENAITRT